MRTTKVGDYLVNLTALYGEYNCGNKTTGRLELVVTVPKSSTNVGAAAIHKELESNKLRDVIIFNFLRDLDERTTFIPLRDGCKFFPHDTGVYPPGVLIYADRVVMNKSYTWYNNWKGLIEVFETESKFGVVVIKSPILANKYYGPSAPSRVWTLVLPAISQHVCWDKDNISKDMKKSLEELAGQVSTSKLLTKELKALGVG